MAEIPRNEPLAAMFAAHMVIICGLINQKVVNREKLIDYLARVIADLPEGERLTLYGQFLDSALQMLEGTQFEAKD